MRAIVHHTFGEPADVLVVEDRPVPEPGPGQVRLRVLLAVIHNHDLWTVRGSYGFVPDLPAAAGTEAVGVIEALGDGVEGLRIGQRVTAMQFGAWAQQVVVRAAGVVPVPEGMPDEAAAQLLAMPFSAVSLLESLGLARGDRLVQNAANGAVGRMVAQLGGARGIAVTGLVRRSAAVDDLARQGIDGIVSTDEDGWRERAGSGFRAAIDSIGGRAAGDLVALLADGGTLVVFGTMGAPRLDLPAGDLIFKQAVVRGFWGSVVSRTMPADTRVRLMREVIAAVVAGTLTLPVSATFGIEDVRAAVRASLTPGAGGKVLLRP